MTKKELKELIKEVIAEQNFTQESIGSKLKGMVSNKWQLSDEPYEDSWVKKNIDRLGGDSYHGKELYNKLQKNFAAGSKEIHSSKQYIDLNDGFDPETVYVVASWFGYVPEVDEKFGIILRKRGSPKTQAQESNIKRFAAEVEQRKSDIESRRAANRRDKEAKDQAAYDAEMDRKRQAARDWDNRYQPPVDGDGHT